MGAEDDHDYRWVHRFIPFEEIVNPPSCDAQAQPMELQGLVRNPVNLHNTVVTITYPNGTVLEAILLSHEEDEIRATSPDCDDVLIFTRIRSTWISEDLEPVAIAFAWQRRGASHVPAEDECVCPKGLAARLIASLLNGCEPDGAAEDTFHVFSPEGNRVAIRRSELHPM
jgi:hypothetical protein